MKIKLKTTKLLKCYSLTPIFIFLLLFSSFAQNNNFNLLGKVIDEKTQFPLGGATIEIKGAYHVQGLSYKMIVDKCFISYFTVNTHVKNIYKKLQVNSVVEAVTKAIDQGIV